MPQQQNFFETSWSMDHRDFKPLKIGFIGAGQMSEFAVIPSMYLAEIECVAICDLDEKRAKLIADKVSGGKYYTDYKQMWEKEDIEAVSVQLQPGETRNKIAKEALEAGYHVIMPKPPTVTYEECVKLAEVASKAGKNLMVNFETRFSYGVRMAKKTLKEDSFGQLTSALFSFCTGSYKERMKKWGDHPYTDSVHAYILDFTPHHLDIARYLCGEVKKMALFHNEINNESSNAIAVQFESGAVGTFQFTSNRIWWRNYDRIELTGQEEYVVLDGLWNIKRYSINQNTFTENYRDERSAELTGDGFSMREFVASVRENREPISSIQDCCKTMELYQAIYDAVQKGKEGVIFKK